MNEEDIKSRLVRIETKLDAIPCEKRDQEIEVIADGHRDVAIALLKLEGRVGTAEASIVSLKMWREKQEKKEQETRTQKIAVAGGIIVALIAALASIIVALLKV